MQTRISTRLSPGINSRNQPPRKLHSSSKGFTAVAVQTKFYGQCSFKCASLNYGTPFPTRSKTVPRQNSYFLITEAHRHSFELNALIIIVVIIIGSTNFFFPCRCLKKTQVFAPIRPQSWNTLKQPADPRDNFVLCEVQPDIHKPEYDKVQEHFAATMDKRLIIKIERVQNIEAWDEFVR